MSISVRFHPANLNAERYEQVHEKMRAAGQDDPEARQLHVCFGNEGELKVSEVWESEEKLRAHGEHLMPVLEEVGDRDGHPAGAPADGGLDGSSGSGA